MINIFRAAGKSDAEAVANLVNKAYRPKSGESGWTHEADLLSGNRTSVNQVGEIISKPGSIMLVGLYDSEIAACVHIEKEGDNCRIGMLAVAPTMQGAGAGKQMLAYAERYASEHFGSEKFTLVVVSSRRELISFYLRRGYQQTGSVMDYPLSAGAGAPKHTGLKIEVLEKAYITLNQAGCARHAPNTSGIIMHDQDAPIAIVATQVAPRVKPSNYPEPFASRMAGREKRQLGDLFGLANFGVNLTRLLPGACSALRHAHSKQDEFIYILHGHPVLLTDAGETQLAPGMCAGFKAGTGNAHQLVNRTNEEVSYLEVGDRSADDSAHYPDDDIQALLVDGKWQFTHKDGSPY